MPGLAIVLLLFRSLGRARRVVTTIYKWNFRVFYPVFLFIIARFFFFKFLYFTHDKYRMSMIFYLAQRARNLRSKYMVR